MIRTEIHLGNGNTPSDIGLKQFDTFSFVSIDYDTGYSPGFYVNSHKKAEALAAAHQGCGRDESRSAEGCRGGGRAMTLNRHALSHPLEKLVIEVAIKFEGALAKSLEEIAMRRNQAPVDMLADAITSMIEDDMFDAVIDDERERAK